MVWLLAITVLILLAYVSNLNGKVKALAEQRDPSNTFHYRVNALEAVMSHPKFAHFTRIVGAAHGKPFKDWSREDRAKWHQISGPILDSTSFLLQYLPADDAYYVKAQARTLRSGMRPADISLVTQEGHRTTRMIHSAYVLGDLEGNKEHLELQVYERLVNGVWVISVGLNYSAGLLEDHNFQHLCDFPVMPHPTKDELRRMGFEVKVSGGDDWWEDVFGEGHSIPTMVDIDGGGVTFSTRY